MEDILFISNEIKESLLRYCTEDLLNFVLEDFGHNHEIVDRDERPPIATWVIDNYINERHLDDRRNILAVILSFAFIGCLVRFNGKNYIGDGVLLTALSDSGLVSEEDMLYFIDAFDDISHGINTKFDLNK